MITNSGWKDYSTGSTNYAYENFDAAEEAHRKQLSHGNQKSGNSRNGYGGPGQGYGYYGYPPGYGGGDTRSLQRPAPSKTNGHPRGMERPTHSLPRTGYSSGYSSGGYYTSDRSMRTPSELQPDFYFMPSQRKYSGEVVRVYVDYNNQPK